MSKINNFILTPPLIDGILYGVNVAPYANGLAGIGGFIF